MYQDSTEGEEGDEVEVEVVTGAATGAATEEEEEEDTVPTGGLVAGMYLRVAIRYKLTRPDSGRGRGY